MTLQEQIAADNDLFAGDGELCEDVVRIESDGTRHEGIRGTVLPEPVQRMTFGNPRHEHRVRVVVSSSEAGSASDTWEVRDETWQVILVDEDRGGLRDVHLRRDDIEDRTQIGDRY